MTFLTISVDEQQADLVKKLLKDVTSVKILEEKNGQIRDQSSALERIKNILDKAKGKDLFKDIEDPSEWQRQIRKEWERDL